MGCYDLFCMENFYIERVYLPTETLGSMYYSDGTLICKTMELPWKDNKRGISCIPEGTYKVIKQPPKADRNYWYLRFVNVPGRSGILIHRITYVKDLKGCIGVGGAFKDLNGDDVPDMVESSKTLQKMIETLPDEFMLTIKKKQ